MKQLELSDSGSAPGRWHQHLLEILRNDAELLAQRHGEQGLHLEGGPSNPAGLRSRPRAPAPCASDSKRPDRTSIAARSDELPGSLRYRTEKRLAPFERELHKPEQTGHTTGATGNRLLDAQYYGCWVVELYHDDRTHLGLSKETPGGRIREAAQGRVVSHARFGGLHHRYDRAA